ncbi:hypothetical protein M9H77_29862 [Catharanthus roseus]|uniref:Uncharacterized protein n=1 Tax=Catharanthus roseus TaxID=4058 RepID=A0ACB9ZVM9_CATRO|nr:hypothetical protein M9H77_29862 [Catharanthus roseus]
MWSLLRFFSLFFFSAASSFCCCSVLSKFFCCCRFFCVGRPAFKPVIRFPLILSVVAKIGQTQQYLLQRVANWTQEWQQECLKLQIKKRRRRGEVLYRLLTKHGREIERETWYPVNSGVSGREWRTEAE